jgi:hypothetical protein
MYILMHRQKCRTTLKYALNLSEPTGIPTTSTQPGCCDLSRKGHCRRRAIHDLNDFLHGLYRIGTRVMSHMAPVHARRSNPWIRHAHPISSLEPRHAIDIGLNDLAFMKKLMNCEPVINSRIDPAVKPPEHRVYMRGILLAQEIIFWIVPLGADVS